MKQTLLITISILLFLTLFANSQTKMSRTEYIDTYKNIAIREMHRSGIPASITLAQGCLESSNGNSVLARKSNNHFGIKCKSDWKGARTFHNDDKLNECFRKYRTVVESYIDHTDFLMDNPRYGYLFKLSHRDYDAWAKGLKKAGYATDPKYASRLIKIIEDEKLHTFDEVELEDLPKEDVLADKGKNYDPYAVRDQLDKTTDKIKETFEDLRIDISGRREIRNQNGLECIYAKRGDTYASIAREFDMKDWEILVYNDLSKSSIEPQKDELIYLQRKRYNAPKGNDFHTLKPQETLREVSQKYGMKLNRLYRLNRLKKGEKAIVGDKLYLRKKKPKSNN